MRNPAFFRAARCFPLLALLLPAALGAQGMAPLPAPTNLDFEQGQPGEVPTGWLNAKFSRESGYTVKIVTDKPQSGHQAVEVGLAGEPKDSQAFGNFMTYFDAAPYRGKRVRFRAWVRAEVDGRNSAALWLRVDREGGARGFFDNMNDRPITSPEWKPYEITGEVAPDAKGIVMGLMLLHRGKAWIDATSFEVLGAVETRHEPARPLAGRGLENLTAFARLFGYVRYFHPSDQAAAADWEALALAGVQAIEPAQSPGELAKALENFFRPLAPTVRVYSTAGRRTVLPNDLKAAAGTEVVYWQHFGVKLSPQPNIYSSERVSSARAPKGAEVTQAVNATAWRGKRVTLRGVARGKVTGDGAAVVKLKVYGKNGLQPLAELKPGIAGNAWQPFEVSGDVPADAEEIEVDLGLTAGGRAGWDDLSLQAPGVASSELGNADFEIAGYDGSAAGWDLKREARLSGYRSLLSTEGPKSGKSSLLLTWTAPDPASAPRPGEPLVADLGGGVSALIPLALYKNDQGTLPHVPVPPPGKPDAAKPSGSDRATRLADVVLAWNVFQHFYPYFDVVPADWPDELRRALTTAATDGDERAFLATLRRLVAALQDGHGSVSASFEGVQAHLPLLWDWVEGHLVITRVAATGAGGLRPGDVVVTLNGRPAAEALAAIEEQVSGATPQWRRWRALNLLALSDPKSAVKIEARHPDGTAVAASLTAALAAYDLGSLQETRPEKIAELRPGIFYVNIDQVTEDDFKGAVDRLAAAKGIIFDLRGYPSHISPVVLSHLIDHPFASARWNVPVVTRPDRQGWSWETSGWFEQPVAPHFPGKIAFVTDGRAISYAESYMGIVEAYHVGEIVGGPTAGTNGNVNPFTLPGGYRLTWTGMKVLKHDGCQHHGVGIQPTVLVSRTIQGVAAGRDELLEKAIAVVGQ